MRNMLYKLFLMTMISSLSVFVYAAMENNSILRFESKRFDPKIQDSVVVYAVAMPDGSVVPMTADDTRFKLENSLWVAKGGSTGFTLQNLGTSEYLDYDNSGTNYWLRTTDTQRTFKEDRTGYYCSITLFSILGRPISGDYYIQYDPSKDKWCFYADGDAAINKNQSQSQGGWTDKSNPQSNETTAMEIPGKIVDEMFGGDELDLEAIKNAVESGDLMDKFKAPAVSIVVGDKDTYPAAGSGFWKTATIQLKVNRSDWTPVSFPIDVKCVTADLAGVGYQYYDTQARATNGKGGWVTGYVTASTVFNQGVAYHFATDSKTMTLEFKPVSQTTLTTIENSVTKTLAPMLIGGDSVNANWYYIGNALFKNANMSKIDKISRYNGSIWVEEPVSGPYDPFDAFFVQYSGDYTMATSTSARSNAPMRDREVVTEKYCLNIAGEDTEDKTYLYFEDGASAEGYVIGEDFLSFATIGGANTEIYTYAGDIDYSFNTRPIENTLVYVGLYIAKAGTYTISLDNISGNAETFVLYDNYEQDFVRLHLGETYTFYSERGEFNDRFGVAVTYAPEVPTDNISLSANKLIVVNNEIQGLTLDSELVVYDSTGRLVCAVNVDSETMTLPNLNSGIYIARNGNGWAKFLVK